ncbi:hypothetical protein HAV27_05535 [Providencia rettgeri]|uniref:F4 family fimbrial subunit n=1 Tax=Providencia rettgeri TaxID=587 RepID=UPI00140473C5|nr:hypothetical protein [Providencia rettgeri]NHN51111.1 hypothetical protein [Providencia rettgeri]
MKKILALAIATALASPMALADNTPDNVGDVTYMGNIVANSPMWQWTVNDYPGGRLDADPSDMVESGGKYTYPLKTAQSFIAFSGYLPSRAGINLSSLDSSLGLKDIVSLTGADGKPIMVSNTGIADGSAYITIPTVVKDSSGKDVAGSLTLKAYDMRASHVARGGKQSNGGPRAYNGVTIIYPTGPSTGSDSCFVSGSNWDDVTVSGTPAAPQISGTSSAAVQALVSALKEATAHGNVDPSVIEASNWNDNYVVKSGETCDTPTMWTPHGNITTSSFVTRYAAGARILELKPVEISFNTPVSGAWSSTLTVTAYQM